MGDVVLPTQNIVFFSFRAYKYIIVKEDPLVNQDVDIQPTEILASGRVAIKLYPNDEVGPRFYLKDVVVSISFALLNFSNFLSDGYECITEPVQLSLWK